jgi:hemolysin-activating ACP:hemolysin acyltransferase
VRRRESWAAQLLDYPCALPMRHHGLQSAVIRRLCPLLPVNRCSYFTHKRRGNTLVWWSLFSGQPLLELVSKTGRTDAAWWLCASETLVGRMVFNILGHFLPPITLYL